MILTPAPPSPREKSRSQLPVAQSSRCGVWGRRAQSALDSAGSGRPGRRGRSLSCPRHRQGTRFPAGERPPFALLCGAPRRPRLRRADSWRGTDAEWRGDGRRRRLDGAQPHLGAWAWGLQEAVLQDARSSFRRTEWHLRRWRARVAVTRGDCAPSVTLMELVRDANSPLRLNEGESVLTFLSEWRAGVDIERASEKRKTVPLGSSGLVRATRVQPGVRGLEQSESSSEFAGGAFCLQFVKDAHLRGAARGLPSLLLLSQPPPCVPSTWLALQAASFLSREVPKRAGYHRAPRRPAAFRESLRLKHQKSMRNTWLQFPGIL